MKKYKKKHQSVHPSNQIFERCENFLNYWEHTCSRFVYILCYFYYWGRMNSGCALLGTVHAILVRLSSTNSYCIYKPSWNNFTNYPASALNMSLMTVCERRRARERNSRVDAHLQMTSSSSSFNDFPRSILTLSLSLILLSSSIASNFHIEATHSSRPTVSPSSQKLSDSAGAQCVGLWIRYFASHPEHIRSCSPIYSICTITDEYSDLSLSFSCLYVCSNSFRQI